MNRRIRRAKNFWRQVWLTHERLLRVFRRQRAVQLTAGADIERGQAVCVDDVGLALPLPKSFPALRVLEVKEADPELHGLPETLYGFPVVVDLNWDWKKGD